jgi:hypothetical protein
MRLRRNENIYLDEAAGGWVVEFLALGDWYVYNVYGELEAAQDAVRKARRP